MMHHLEGIAVVWIGLNLVITLILGSEFILQEFRIACMQREDRLAEERISAARMQSAGRID